MPWDSEAEVVVVVDVVAWTVAVDEVDLVMVDVIVVVWAVAHKVVPPERETGIAPTRTVETTTLDGARIVIAVKQLNQAVMVVEVVDLSVVEDSVVDVVVLIVDAVVDSVAVEEWTEDVADSVEEWTVGVVAHQARWTNAETCDGIGEVADRTKVRRQQL